MTTQSQSLFGCQADAVPTQMMKFWDTRFQSDITDVWNERKYVVPEM
jgi:hypothetical protein